MRVRQARSEGATQVNQWWKSRKRRAGSNLVDTGRSVARGHSPSTGGGWPTPTPGCSGRAGGHGESLRRNRGEATGIAAAKAPVRHGDAVLGAHRHRRSTAWSMGARGDRQCPSGRIRWARGSGAEQTHAGRAAGWHQRRTGGRPTRSPRPRATTVRSTTQLSSSGAGCPPRVPNTDIPMVFLSRLNVRRRADGRGRRPVAAGHAWPVVLVLPSGQVGVMGRQPSRAPWR